MLNNYVTSAIRTGVPGLVGWLLGWLVTWGLAVPTSVRAWAVGLITFALLLAYYLAVRALEQRWPQLGWLLGTPTKPRYDVDVTPVKVVDTPKPAAPPATS